ncbi:MAG: hypothetical protein IT249_19395 [Chitinophagaceae bacterium]|nr:hypothetical protein [Chitinophagaceae bacterium]
MNIYYIYIYLLFAVNYSCNEDSVKVSLIQSSGLSGPNLRLNSLLLFAKDAAFIAGSSDSVFSNRDIKSDTFAFVHRTAVVYRTLDKGKTWEKKELGEGSIQKVLQVNNRFFITKISDEVHRQFLYSSSDSGQNWRMEKTFPEGINNIFFINGTFIVTSLEFGEMKTNLYTSNDGGNTWKNLSPSFNIFDVVINNNNIFFLSSDEAKGKKNILIQYELTNQKENIIRLPNNFNCSFLTGYDNHIVLTGLNNDEIIKYSFEEGEIKFKYSIPKENTSFLQGFYSDAKQDWYVLAERKRSEVVNQLLTISNDGKIIEHINFQYDKYIKPYSFIYSGGKTIGMFYSGSGKFQLIEK